MKYIILFLFSFVLIEASSAQPKIRGGNKNIFFGLVSGKLIDKKSNEVIAFATLSLYKPGQDKPITGAISDEKGRFKIEKVPIGIYKMLIEAIGYSDKTVENVIVADLKPDARLGNVYLEESSTKLNEVVVEAQANVIENKIDKVVFNVDKDASLVGRDAEDALRKVPYVSIDQDGNPSIRGNTNIKFYIDGKPSVLLSNDPGEALKAIPADQIKSIEVITTPSAKYDAEGTGGIINIITKKNSLEGMLANASLLVANKRNRFNGTFAKKVNRFGVNFAGGLGFNWPEDATTYYRKDWGGNFIQRAGTVQSQRIAGRSSLGFDYQLNKFDNFNLSINYYGVRFTREGEVGLTYSDPNQNSRLLQNAGRFRDNFNVNFDYTHAFKNDKHKLVFLGQYTDSNSNSNNINEYISISKLDANNLGKNKESSFQLDYTLPLGKQSTFEVGIKYVDRNVNSDYNGVFDSFGLSTLTMNLYNYDENLSSAYGSFHFPLVKNITLITGLRMENTQIDGAPEIQDEKSPAVKNSYLEFFPNFIIQYKKGAHAFKLAYNKRISRPRVNAINPYANTYDPQEVVFGNPNLLPEIGDSFELGYSGFIKGLVLNTAFFYRETSNIIDRYVTNSEDGSVATYQNVGTNFSYGVNMFAQINIKNRFSLRGSLDLFRYNVSPNSGYNLGDSNLDWVYRSFLSASYTYKGVIAEMFGLFRSQRRSIQGTRPSFTILVFSLKKEIFDEKGSLGITFIDPFTPNKEFRSEIYTNDFSQVSSFILPFRSIGLNFSYRIGKLKTQNRNRGRNVDGGGEEY